MLQIQKGQLKMDKKSQQSVSMMESFMYWLKLGFISFGGPAGQISMMHQELVKKRRWISNKRFLHALNYTMILPGPEAQQLATYIGWLMHGVRGGIMAGVLFVLPSLFILIALTWIYLAYGNVSAIAGILYGIKPAVTAIVLFAAYRIGSKALPNPVLKAIAAIAFIAIFALKIPFPYIVIGAALIGIFGSKIAPDLFQTSGHHGDENANFGSALIDDNTPAPEHAKFKWSRVISYLVIGLIAWLAAMALLTALYGWDGTLTKMGWFFTKAALVTFGGAYAVLPYVYQGGVEQFSWLTGTQMIDGLALGETTPGPLIMVVSFVGFVGAWTKEVFGPEMLPIAGAIGATVAAFFTFLPSFLFILIGGPAVEATRDDLKFTAPLTAITAAVVGVILNLAVFFALHVLWPENQGLDFSGNFEWFALLIGIAAFIGLVRFKLGIMTVIIASAMLGLGHQFII